MVVRALAAACVLLAAGSALMPLWADGTPVYPPVLGPLVVAPLWLVAAFALWSSAR